MKQDYTYYNMNPDKREISDCVCRAITLGLGLKYNTVKKLLELCAVYYDCDPLYVGCYHHLLEDVFELPVRYCDDSETVEEIAQMYPNNKVIIRIEGHLTCAVHGTIFDIWDCTDKIADCYWIA